MAEGKSKPPKAAGDEDKNEPTERQVLAGFELDPERVAKALVEAGHGQTPETANGDKDAREKLAAAIAEGLGAGKIMCWVELGQAPGDKKTAINSIVGDPRQLGFYRAPALRAWKGAVARRPPAQIEPDEEQLD